MSEIEELRAEIEAIKKRNKRVESNKDWETSWLRRIFIAVSTYILVAILLISISNDKPYINAIVPAIAYLVSTSSLEMLRSWWLKKRNKNDNTG